MRNEKLERTRLPFLILSFSFLISNFAFSVPPQETIATRWDPPEGFWRVSVTRGSFGAWLRNLPLLPGNPPVHLYDASLKRDQDAHAAVVDMDVGNSDLEQCADAVVRLRAEYLLASYQEDKIAFHFTSGDKAAWSDWKRGMRPDVHGSHVTWKLAAKPDSSYQSFRRYLDKVFEFAGTMSLAKELKPVSDPSRVEVGDVFIHPGSPGHAVIVVDVAESDNGERVFMLAQSYMPAQQIEILRTPLFPRTPWYPARSSGVLETPEWTFQYSDLKRFP